ncbi:MAG: hypothetical protein Kow0088_14490 [Anaerolineales bacterium]
MNHAANRFHPWRKLPRKDYLRLIRYAYANQDYLFAAQLALDWLTDFPGDLPIRYRYGEARARAGHLSLAANILDEILEQDPEFTEAVQTRLQIEEQITQHELKHANPFASKSSYTISDYQEWLIALQGYDAPAQKRPYEKLEMRWGEEIFPLRKSLASFTPIADETQTQELHNHLNAILAVKSNHPLVAITHVKSLYLSYKGGMIPLPSLKQIVEYYSRMFPNCLFIGYIAVEALLESGENEQAVAALHSLAARDLSAQVAQRIWDANHPFLQIWPKNLEKQLTIPIPANIAAMLGWNQLPWQVSQSTSVEFDNQSDQLSAKSPLTPRSNGIPHLEPEQNDATKELHVKEIFPDSPNDGTGTNSLSAELSEIQAVFNRIGARFKQQNVVHLDGRQPVYVAMSNKSQMLHYFGADRCSEIQAVTADLLAAIEARKGWPGVLYFVDEGLDLSNRKYSLQIPAISQNDPWAIKQALQQLDTLLAKRGQMIGALLIIGSHEIIPFHRLPNPIEDGDHEVYSDNPYGSRDENFLVMDWPVGRLPCALQQPEDLIKSIRNLLASYRGKNQAKAGSKGYAKSLAPLWSWFQYLFSLFQPPTHNFSAFGYTAAAWRFASFAVYRQIGNPQSMLISPQMAWKIPSAQAAKHRLVRHTKALNTLEAVEMKVHSQTQPQLATTDQISLPNVTAGYFNLHGLADSPEWFGQSDPIENAENLVATSDHPIALQPGDLLLNPKAAMDFVFSEACFGAYILDKDATSSLALAFLKKGCRAFVGSTSTSYGSNGTPLIAADFLAYEFWKNLRQGLPAGEALRQAKLTMASELSKTYGYLDGEDQKTLISFVLYGDPLAQVSDIRVSPKVTRHSKSIARQISSICDHAFQSQRDEELSPQMESLVKKLVAKHLPGLDFSTVEVLSENLNCSASCTACHVTQQSLCSAKDNSKPTNGKQKPTRKIIILTRQERRNDHIYTQYARLTLDSKGRLIKLSLSR